MPRFSQTELIRLSMQMGLMALESQRVVTMRLLGMGGMWNVAPTEDTRMVDEKSEAALASATAAGRAALQGKSAAGVALAALKPLRAKTKANAKRLTKRGPAIPKITPDKRR
jgi:hypothetical protein